ncbi:hypothetical protein HY469_05150 [Candidatus Roizmanbacteria bacterium]|nr:hypothetical protein [Candidatus Roizmanbacteria bacterium]
MLEKQMTRREFLRNVGMGVLLIPEVSSPLDVLTPRQQWMLVIGIQSALVAAGISHRINPEDTTQMIRSASLGAVIGASVTNSYLDHTYGPDRI